MNTFARPQYQDSERKPLLKLIPETAKRILDIGCNTGSFGLALKEIRPTEIWGVEPDQEAASIASRRLDHVITDFFSYKNPIPCKYFDMVVFNDSLEHMPDPTEALILAKEKLRDGGLIQCCVPNMLHIENIEHLIFHKDWQYTEHGVRDRTHLRFFTEKSIIRLFENTGIKVLRTIMINEDWWDGRKYIRRILFNVFRNFTKDMRHTQIVIIGEPAQ